MRFPRAERMHSLYLILILLEYGTIGQCSALERRAASSSSKTSASSHSTSSPSISSHFTSSSVETSTSSSHSQTSTSTSQTSAIVEVYTATVEALPESTQPRNKPLSTPSTTVRNLPSSISLSNGSPPKETPPGDGSDTKTPQASATTLPGNSNTELPKGPATKPGDRPNTASSERPSMTTSHDSHTTGLDTDAGDSSKTKSSSSSNNSQGWGGGPDNTITSPTTTTPSTTYTNGQVTITSAPNWGDQEIPMNTCDYIAPGGDIEWNPCMVYAGTVQLSFFPENKGNLTYPKTYFDPALSLTLTSPSVYLVIDTLTASNSCGRLGPTYKNFVLSLDLTEVFTMQPYPDATAQNRLGDPRQLTLADLATDCPKYSDRPADQNLVYTDGATVDPHPVSDDWNRCNPYLSMPDQMKSVGLPYWRHCGNDNGHFGIFDPPGAVPPVQGIFPITSPTPVVPTTVNAIPSPTVQPAPAPTTPSQDPPPKQDTSPVQNSPPATPEPAPLPSTQPADTQPATEPSVLAIIGTNTINALPESAGVQLQNGASVTAGEVTTLLDSNYNPVVVSVAKSGIIIQESTTSQFIANPTTPIPAGVPAPIATIGNQIITAQPGATSLVVNKQTLIAGGPPITIDGTNNVATLGSAGLIIQYPSGLVSTFAIPTAQGSAPTPVGIVPQVNSLASDINGVPIATISGGSAVVVGTKTISVGGPPATIPVNIVVTLAPQGLIIQKPGGIVSTLTLNGIVAASTTAAQTTGGSLGGIIASMAGISGPPPQPLASSDSPTPAINSPSSTSPGDASASLSSTSILSTSPQGFASLVASIAGVTLQGYTVITLDPSPTTSSNGTSAGTASSGNLPTVVFTSSASISELQWLWGCILLLFSAVGVGWG